MAERRMFAKAIVLSDAFLDMPMSARCLYFTLSMFADDDGFVGSPKALNVQLAGDAFYFGKLVKKPFIGDAIRDIENEDIKRANKLMVFSEVFLCGVGLMVMVALAYCL